MSVRGVAALSRPPSTDLACLLVLHSLHSGNLAHLPYASDEARRASSGVDDPAEGLRRPISAYALASSLGVPFETVRRKLKHLEAENAVMRVDVGYVVAARSASEGSMAEALKAVRRLARNTLGRIVRAGVDLDAFCDDVSPPEGFLDAGPAPELLEARVLMDAILRGLESWPATVGGLMCSYILSGLADANTSHFDDADRSHLRFATLDDAPPDALRRPASARALARDLGLPATTVQRRLAHLIEAGHVTDLGRGALIVPGQVLDEGVMQPVAAMLALQGVRMLGNLKRIGVDLAALAEEQRLAA